MTTVPFVPLHMAGPDDPELWLPYIDGAIDGRPHRHLFTHMGSSTGMDSLGQSQDTPMYRMSACTVGGITLTDEKVVVVPLPQDPMPMDVLLGYPAISQYVWTMDYPLNRWAATPAR